MNDLEKKAKLEEIDNMSEQELNEKYDKLLNSSNIQDGQLTDEEVDEIIESMKKVGDSNPIIKEISNLPSNNGVTESESTLDNTEAVVNVLIHPDTGEHVVLGEVEEKDPIKEYDEFNDETFDKLWNSIQGHKLEDIELDEKVITTSLKEQYGDIDPIEITQFVALIKDYQKGNQSNVYGRLPKTIKSTIDKVATEANIPNVNIQTINSYKKQVAKQLIDEFISDTLLNSATIEFQEGMDRIFKEANTELQQLYPDSFNGKIEQLQQMYDSIHNNEESSEEELEKAKKLLEMKHAMEQTYSLEEFKEKLPTIKIKKFDLEKPKKYYDKFNYKYQNSVYNIHSIILLEPILLRLFTDYDQKTITKFIVAICKYCASINPSNIVEHTFMYYLVTNIIFLGSNNKEDEIQEFTEGLMKNISACLDILK